MDDDLKLLDLEISRFRGFTGGSRAPLRFGDVTVLIGANGHGKTTVFDAIDWALFGDEWRWGQASTDVTRGLRRPDDVPSVTVRFRNAAPHVLVRRGAKATLDGASFDASWLCRNQAIFARSGEVVRALRGVTYLPQESLRSLVMSNADSERRSLLATLAGVPFADRFEKNLRNTRGDLEQRRRAADKDLSQVTDRKAELRGQLDSLRGTADMTLALESQVRVFLGPANTEPLLVEDLLARRIAEFEQSERNLETKAQDERQLADQLTEVIHDQVSAHRGLAAAAAELEEVQRRLTDAIATERQLLDDQAQALTALEELGAAVEQARAAQQAAERQELHQRSVAEARAAVASSSARMEECSAAVGTLRQEAIAAEAASEATSQSVAVVRQRVSRATEREAVLIRKAELERRLSTLQARRREAEAARANAVTERVAVEQRARQALVELDELRSQLLQSLGGAEQVARIIGELLAVQSGTDPKCLVCGHNHADGVARADAMRRQLRQASDATRLSKAVAAAELRSTSEASQVRVVEERVQVAVEQLAALDAKIAHLLAQRNSLDAELAARADEEEAASPETYAAALRESEELAAAAYAALAALRERLEAASEELSRTSARHETAAKALEALVPATLANATFVEGARVAQLQQVASVATEKLREARATAEAAATLQATRGLEVIRLRQHAAALEGAASAAAERAKELDDRRVLLLRRVEDLGIRIPTDEASVAPIVRLAAAEAEENARRSREAASTGRELQGPLRALKSRSRAQAIEAELIELSVAESNARVRVERVRAAQRRLDQIGAVVGDAIRDAAASSLQSAEARINELLAELCPHQHLNVLRMAQGGILSATDEAGSPSVKPEHYGSTGQLGCMGLSVFLGIALGQRWSRLRVLLLDEPVQNMDDVNFVRFLDLVRRLAETHQVVVSTADKNIGELLKRKLLLWADGQTKTAIVHHFVGFDVEAGPSVMTEELGRLRAVAG